MQEKFRGMHFRFCSGLRSKISSQNSDVKIARPESWQTNWEVLLFSNSMIFKQLLILRFGSFHCLVPNGKDQENRRRDQR